VGEILEEGRYVKGAMGPHGSGDHLAECQNQPDYVASHLWPRCILFAAHLDYEDELRKGLLGNSV
jgi:hypothetical protein